MVISVAWSPDGARLASGGGGRGSGEIFVWDTHSEAHSGERLHALSELSEIVYALAWSPTGAVLVSGDSDGMLRWWDLQRGECVQVRQAHQGTVQSLKVSPDGRLLASCGDDGAITLWNLHSGEYLRTLRRDRPYERLDITGIKGVTDCFAACPAGRESASSLPWQRRALPGRLPPGFGLPVASSLYRSLSSVMGRSRIRCPVA